MQIAEFLKSLGWAMRDTGLGERLYVLRHQDFPHRQLVFPMDIIAPSYPEATFLVFDKLGEMLHEPSAALLHRALLHAQANLGVVVDYPLCQPGGGTYDFKSVCCRVQFIMCLPGKAWRVDWIEKWRDENREMAGLVENAVRVRWGKR